MGTHDYYRISALFLTFKYKLLIKLMELSIKILTEKYIINLHVEKD